MLFPPPKYVNLPGCNYPPPAFQIGCNARIYVLPASKDKLQQVVDEWLNLPFNDIYQYVPLPWVSLFTMPIQEVRCLPDVPTEFKGYSAEVDVAFLIILAAYRGGVIDHFALAYPYIMVSNPIALTTGREVWGFRKAFALFDFLPGTKMPIRASTWVMTDFNETTALHSLEVMRMGSLIDDLALAPGGSILGAAENRLAGLLVKGGSALQRAGGYVEQMAEKAITTAGDLTARFNSDTRVLAGQLLDIMQTVKRIGKASAGIGTATPDLGVAGLLADAVTEVEDASMLLQEFLNRLQQYRRINVAFLLQQRDITFGNCASYQAVLESAMNFTKIDSVLPIPRTKVILTDYPSYKVVQDLGLQYESRNGNSYTIKPLVAIEAQFDFEMCGGRIIAEAGRQMIGPSGMPWLGFTSR